MDNAFLATLEHINRCQIVLVVYHAMLALSNRQLGNHHANRALLENILH
jgi:hypothetical protein